MTVPGSQVDELLSVLAVLTAGTCTIAANQNDTPIPGLESISVSTVSTGRVTPATFPTPVDDLDTFNVVISDLAGTDADTFLSVDFGFAITP
jgi:hypothetical protein